MKWFHLDVMDGTFVRNISFGPPVIKCIRKITESFFDVHLMINEPIRYIDAFADAGADMLTVHYEACKNLRGDDRCGEGGGHEGWCCSQSGNTGALAGVLHQSGRYGADHECQSRLWRTEIHAGCTYEAAEVKALAGERNPELLIEVDGGITVDNVQDVLDAGANVVVAGSAVFKGDKKANIAAFMEKLNA